MNAYIGNKFNYKTVAASQTTAQICGQGGYIESISVMPASSTPGVVTLIDGSTNIMAIIAGAGDGTKPYTVRVGAFSESTGGFKVTTGASVSVLVSGNRGPAY
jgi:hypothetical protein